MNLERHKNSHKGSNGRVLVVGGSELYTGAPSLCGLAALQAGADLVYIAAPERAANTAAQNPNLITISLPGKELSEKHLKVLKLWFDRVDVLVIGPGLGESTGTKKAVQKIITAFPGPIVIDADALKAIAANLKLLKGKKAVLTPHRREFEILAGEGAEHAQVRAFAIGQDATVLLKAPVDFVTNGHQSKENKTGNEGMTVGGTGDVLAGIVASLIAQKQSLFDAAFNGAKISGLAGDNCHSKKGYGFTASDVINEIPDALQRV